MTGKLAQLSFYTPGVKREELGFLGERAYATVDEAVAAAVEGLPRGAEIALVPEGPYTFARACELVEADAVPVAD